ncbi:MAG: SMC family ATPase [Thaumarchaeota archaeon]|nr:SMC family ATPase [Nitrososphaerota archaeon]
MLLREVTIKNVRSYNDDAEAVVEFPEGVVLFEGDVGSGKSTILYAVEFALFGTAEVKGSFLLSDRKQSGHVRLKFSENGKELEVGRGLVRRKDSVAQERCYIVEDGKRTEMSPADLKERVIGLLKFNEPSNPRAESLVYRFAVFTPQEQMKEIIQKDSEDRLRVLRRVLGISEYQLAAENSDTVEQRIKRDAYGLKRASEDLEEKEALASALSSDIAQFGKRLPILEEKRSAAEAELAELESQSKDLVSKREAVSNVASKVPTLERSVKMLTTAAKDALDKADRLEARLKDQYVPFIEEFEKRKTPSERSAGALDEELAGERREHEEKTATLRVLQNQSEGTEELLREGKCPRCGREIDHAEFGDRAAHLASEIEKTRAEVLLSKDKCSALESLRRQMAAYEKDREKHATYSKERANIKLDISESRAQVWAYQAELTKSTRDLEAARKEEERLKGLAQEIAELERDLGTSRRMRDEASLDLQRALAQRDAKKESLENLASELMKKRSMRAEAQRLGGYQSWLSGFFRPAVEQIEQQTFMQMNARFNHHFQRLFSSMVDDIDLGVRVNENFSPVLERQGFEQEYESLSGGERTSVALAYRLALNAIVQETGASGTGELVILDEPTEGFSKEQIHKMRDILAELRSKQVVIVSHETELEAMAQHVFRVQKVSGTSRVLAA